MSVTFCGYLSSYFCKQMARENDRNVREMAGDFTELVGNLFCLLLAVRVYRFLAEAKQS